MHRVLVIDDEPTLRSSIARGLARAEELTVEEAGNIDGALKLIDRMAPDVIVSDIDLPDRSGIELLGELGRRGLNVPIIFVSAYLKAFRAQIPRHANIEALEKPVPLDQLRAHVLSKLHTTKPSDAPFSVADYLQLACMGRHSVRIAATAKDGTTGTIIVSGGEPWFARFGKLTAADAFSRIAFATDLTVHCSRIKSVEEEKNLHGSVDALLMEAARVFDEASRAPGSRAKLDAEAASEPTLKSPPASEVFEPESGTVNRMFVAHWEAGVDALLGRNYELALEEFQTAHTLNPEDPKVLANLERLHAMGYGTAKKKEEAS